MPRRCEDAHPGEAGGRVHPRTCEDLQAYNPTGAQAGRGSGVCRRAQGDLQQKQAEPKEGEKAYHQELVLHTLRGERTAKPLDDQNNKYPLARISNELYQNLKTLRIQLLSISRLDKFNVESQS